MSLIERTGLRGAGEVGVVGNGQGGALSMNSMSWGQALGYANPSENNGTADKRR